MKRHAGGQGASNHASRNRTEWKHTHTSKLLESQVPSPTVMTASLPPQTEQMLYFTMMWAFSPAFKSELTFPTAAALGLWTVIQTREIDGYFMVLNGMPPRNQSVGRVSNSPKWAFVYIKFLSAQTGNFETANNSFYIWSVFLQMQAIWNIIQLPLPLSCCHLSVKSQTTGCMLSLFQGDCCRLSES